MFVEFVNFPANRYFDDRVARGVGRYQRGVDMKLAAIDKVRFHALLDAAHKQALEDFRSPTFARLAQYTVVWDFIFEPVT